MKFITLLVVLVLLVTGIMARSIGFDNIEDPSCTGTGTFKRADCTNALHFKSSGASCFMSDNDDFVIITPQERMSKRSGSSYVDEYADSFRGKVKVMKRHRRSASDEEDLAAEVLSAKELRDMIKNTEGVNTESPVETNEVPHTTGVDTADGESGVTQIHGIIFVISAITDENNEVTANSQETSPSTNAEEEMTEALFGLLLLNAILEEVKKHQIGNDQDEAMEE